MSDHPENAIAPRFGVLSLVAEIAIDVGIGLVTAGVGGAAFRAIRVVGRRVIDSGTDVVIKLVREGADAVDVKKLRHMDSDLPAEVKDKVPDLEDMQGHPDVETRQTPKPLNSGTTVVKRSYGHNTAEWKTVDGNASEVSARLKEDFGEGTRGKTEIAAQDAVRDAAGIDKDHAGHMIGHRFMRDQEFKNLYPQNGNFNLGAWKRIENEWGRAIRAGYEVDIKIKLKPPGQARPDEVEVRWQYYDKDGKPFGNPIKRRFKNDGNQKYESVYFRTK